MPYLSKGRMSDVNNGPGGDSNSGPILAPGIYSSQTRIVALFFGPGVYLNLTLIMALPWAIPESEHKVAQKQT